VPAGFLASAITSGCFHTGTCSTGAISGVLNWRIDDVERVTTLLAEAIARAPAGDV